MNKHLRNEVFNSNNLMKFSSNSQLNDFICKPVRDKNEKGCLCFTHFYHSTKIGFMVSWRLIGDDQWNYSQIQRTSNIIKVKRLSQGTYEVRVIEVESNKQVASDKKIVELKFDQQNHVCKNLSLFEGKNQMEFNRLLYQFQLYANDMIDQLFKDILCQEQLNDILYQEQLDDSQHCEYYHFKNI